MQFSVRVSSTRRNLARMSIAQLQLRYTDYKTKIKGKGSDPVREQRAKSMAGEKWRTVRETNHWPRDGTIFIVRLHLPRKRSFHDKRTNRCVAQFSFRSIFSLSPRRRARVLEKRLQTMLLKYPAARNIFNQV